jgi:hypothetical protein
MKTQFAFPKTILLGVASLLSFACTAQKTNITVGELPAAAQSFIKANFPNQATSYIIKDTDIHETEYELRFTGGAEVEFDEKGNWKEIDANKSTMPATVLPKAIADYNAKNYKGLQVEKIEKKHYGYKLGFTNDVELEFDNSGKFLRIDD